MQQVLRQTRQRIDEGNAHAQGKIVSLFEPDSNLINIAQALNGPPAFCAGK